MFNGKVTPEQVKAVAQQLGITIEKAAAEIERAIKNRDYRDAYNKRPDVKAKRTRYNRVRYYAQKSVLSAMKQIQATAETKSITEQIDELEAQAEERENEQPEASN